jgi:hypothetical protein
VFHNNNKKTTRSFGLNSRYGRFRNACTLQIGLVDVKASVISRKRGDCKLKSAVGNQELVLFSSSQRGTPRLHMGISNAYYHYWIFLANQGRPGQAVKFHPWMFLRQRSLFHHRSKGEQKGNVSRRRYYRLSVFLMLLVPESHCSPPLLSMLTKTPKCPTFLICMCSSM